MSIFRRTPQAEEPSARVWSIRDVMFALQRKDSFMPLSNQKVRSTDAPFRASAPKVMLTAEDARTAPPPTVHCGFCSWTGPDNDRGLGLRTHRCVDAAGRDLDLVKKAHAEGARRELKALRNYPCPPCMVCGKVYPPGSSHNCSYPNQVLPHDAAAQAAGVAQQRAELQRQLAELGLVSKESQ